MKKLSLRKSKKSGFILILTFFMMAGLVLLIAGLVYLVSYETRDVGIQVEDIKILNLAEAGVQRAKREIRDDKLTTTQVGVADLRGATTSQTSGGNTVAQLNRVRYYNESSGILTLDAAGSGTNVILQNFDLNYLNTKITSVKIGCRYRKATSGGSNPNLTIEYKTGSGSFPEAGNLSHTVTVSSTTFNDPYASWIPLDITADRSWTWDLINSSNFQIRATAYNSANRDVDIDYLFLQVTCEIDTQTEPWFTGSYQAYPIPLGAGTIESVSIADEQGKVHLNTATQGLLRYLMVENGIVDPAASQVATNIINYRFTNQFDSIEELLQVNGMTTTIYNAIAQDVTVYSYINTSAKDPSGARAPVNINFASQAVLEAIFDPLPFNSPSDIPNLANAIIAQRNIAPFKCFYSSDSLIPTDFYDFALSQSYLSTTEDDWVLGNADASLLVPRQGGTDRPALTTEFSYDTYAFKVISLANIGGNIAAGGRNYRVQTILGDDGSQAFTTSSGDTTSSGWRKENFQSPPPP